MTDAHQFKRARLAPVDQPNFDIPLDEPTIDARDYAIRYDRLVDQLSVQGLDAAIIYADREHAANLAWLSGFDPRFEEALLIIVPGRRPTLLTGPENQGAAAIAPLDMDIVLYPPMGLMGQNRINTPPLRDLLIEAGIQSRFRIGACGWKYFGELETPEFKTWLEIPSFIADTLRSLVEPSGYVLNAGAIFMNPDTGLRSTNSIDELARYEFAACHTSEAVKRVICTARPGMREFDAAQALQNIGMPLSCHTMMSSGDRAWQGLLSPSAKALATGDAVTTAYGVQGALNCRAGWLAADAGDLPKQVQDYVEVLVRPYFEAAGEWLETIQIGVEGGTLDAMIKRRLGDPFFGVHLNPGHLIHLEEWMHTPISPGSKSVLRSGMALQLDIIPATGGPYFTTNIEDGIMLLDARGRAEFAEKYPAAQNRIDQRRSYMDDKLGIQLKPDCLPLSNIAGWLPPFWLSPDNAMTFR